MESLPEYGDLGWQNSYDFGKILKGKNIPIDYIAPNTISHQYVPGKGRGMIATRDIFPQEVLIIDHMIYGHESLENMTEGIVYGENTSTHLVEPGNKMKLISKFLKLLKFDGLLVKKLLLLESRSYFELESNNKLPLIQDLEWMGYRSLDYTLSPFLPQTPMEMGVDAGQITFKLIESILNINEFGWADNNSKLNSGAGLGLRLCLFNHEDDAGCKRIAIGDAVVLISKRQIKKGEEISILYGDNVAKWGL